MWYKKLGLNSPWAVSKLAMMSTLETTIATPNEKMMAACVRASRVKAISWSGLWLRMISAPSRSNMIAASPLRDTPRAGHWRCTVKCLQRQRTPSFLSAASPTLAPLLASWNTARQELVSAFWRTPRTPTDRAGRTRYKSSHNTRSTHTKRESTRRWRQRRPLSLSLSCVPRRPSD